MISAEAGIKPQVSREHTYFLPEIHAIQGSRAVATLFQDEPMQKTDHMLWFYRSHGFLSWSIQFSGEP